MVFSSYSNIDINSSQDPHSENSCTWFTLFLGVSELEDAENKDSMVYKYEYVCFPSTAKGSEDIHHLSMDYPYFHNFKYM
jgi:hypothetical protein